MGESIHGERGHHAPGDQIPGQGQFIPGEGHVSAKHSLKGNIKADKQAPDEVLNKDTLDKTDIQRQPQSRATGFAWATLSQNDLDQLVPGDPRIAGHKGQVYGKPPPGATGTANPFFAPNPMIAFFRGFFAIIELMKQNELVGAKLASIEMMALKEVGNAQANAQLEAGKAQAKAAIGQAIMAGINAGVGVASLGIQMNAFRGAKLNVAKTLQSKSDQVASTQKRANDATETFEKLDRPISSVGRAQQKRAQELKQQLMEIKQHENAAVEAQKAGGSADEIFTVFGQKPLPKPPGAAKEAVELGPESTQLPINKAKTTKLTRENEQLMVKEKENSYFKTLDEATDAQGEAKLKHERMFREQQNAYNNAGYKDPSTMSKKELQDELSTVQKDLKGLEKEHTQLMQTNGLEMQKAQAALDDAKFQYKQYKYTLPQNITQMMMADPSYMVSQAMQNILSSATQAGSKAFEAQGALQAAYWNAEEKRLAVDGQILTKGIDVGFDMKRDSDSTVSDVCQTLTKLSDSEQAGMRWAA